MENESSKDFLNSIKSVRIAEVMLKKVEFDKIAMVVMRQPTIHSPQDLINGDFKHIEFAKKFWEDMLEAATKFSAENDKP